MVSSPGIAHMSRQQTTASNSHGTSSRGSRRMSGSDEAVAGAAHGLNRQVAQLPPQSADADLDHVAARVVVQTPDSTEQLLAAAHVAASANQVREQRELEFGECHGLLTHLGSAARHVEPD